MPDREVDLSKLLPAIPETLESFSFEYYRRCDLDEIFKMKKFAKGLICLGVHSLKFNNVDFSYESKISLYFLYQLLNMLMSS